MNMQKKPLIYMLLAVLLCMGIHLYRQLGQQHFPGPGGWNWPVYPMYILILTLWGTSLHNRITQKTIRRCLESVAGIMILWMAVRFVQEQFLQEYTLALRMTGYLIHVPVIGIPLLGFFAACSVGKWEDYRIEPRLYWVLLPAVLLTLAVVTDPVLHLVYLVDEREIQPNLYFHPGPGLWLITLWALGMMAARVAVIFRRNRLLKNRSRFCRCLPFAEVVLLGLYIMPYFFRSFYVERELLEFSVGIFLLEALSWEGCIYVGLVQVNTQYEMVFHESGLGMQILDADGKVLAESRNSYPVSPKIFAQLKHNGMLLLPDGQELWIQPSSGNYLVWQKNVSPLHDIIRRLSRTEAELRQESTLLSQELSTRSARVSLREKNRIYNQLTEEVSGQLELLRQLLRDSSLCCGNDFLLQKICLIGIYIKQRCNLRLIEQTENRIFPEELRHGFRELTDSMTAFGFDGDIEFHCEKLASPGFAIAAYDLFWYVIQNGDFRFVRVKGSFPDSRTFETAVVQQNRTRSPLAPPCPASMTLETVQTEDGFRVRLREGGD